MTSRAALRQLEALENGESLETELCIPCKNALESDDLARIGRPLWLNDGSLDCEHLKRPILYCALCTNIIRAHECANRNGKVWKSQPESPDWFMSSFDGGTLIFENEHCRSDHQALGYDFEPKPDSYVRTVDPVPDAALLRSWIKTCEGHHGTTCNGHVSASVSAGVDIRFIDVTKKCIVSGSLTGRHFALSYVWGSAVQFKLLKSNLPDMAVPNALSQAPLPQTIKDSMSLVASMGERYLWVDALCIVQDDDAGKGVQISQMASIYTSALVTIVALSGTSASSGLPGVFSSLPRNSHTIQIAPGLLLAPRKQFSDLFKDSVYNSRAWTFQEQILSRRCLFFTEQQIYYQCLSSAFCEDRFGHCIEDSISSMNPLSEARIWSQQPKSGLDLTQNGAFRYYSRFIADYTSKSMGYLSDILNAFTGISVTLSAMYDWKFWEGIPDSLIDFALLWTPLEMVVSRKVNGLLPFCSASWAGWVGSVHYGDMVQEMPQRPLLEGFKSCISLFSTTGPSRIALGPAWTRKASENVAKPITNVFSQANAPILAFRAFSVPATRFLIKPNPKRLLNRSSSTLVTPNTHFLFDSDSRRCGILYGFTPTNPTNIWTNIDVILLSTFSHANSFQAFGPILTFWTEDGLGSDERLFDQAFEDKKWCTLNVLLVEWKQNIAYRVGIGQICRETCNSCGFVEKDIFLS
jgi:hypothetical protein